MEIGSERNEAFLDLAQRDGDVYKRCACDAGKKQPSLQSGLQVRTPTSARAACSDFNDTGAMRATQKRSFLFYTRKLLR